MKIDCNMRETIERGVEKSAATKRFIAVMESNGFVVECLVRNHQYRVGKYYYWPSTERFMMPGNNKGGVGLSRLLGLLSVRDLA